MATITFLTLLNLNLIIMLLAIDFYFTFEYCPYATSDQAQNSPQGNVNDYDLGEVNVANDRSLDTGREMSVHLQSRTDANPSACIRGKIWYENVRDEGQDAEPIAVMAPSGRFGALVVADGLGGRGGRRLTQPPFLTGAKIAADYVTLQFSYNLVLELVENSVSGSIVSPSSLAKISEIWQIVDDVGWNANHISKILGILIEISSGEGLLDKFDVERLAGNIDRLFSTLATKLTFQISSVKSRLNRKLPTTFSAMLFDVSNDFTRLRLIWAGDSRAYVINDNGLALLSEDDQTDFLPTEKYHIARGKMTNFISECVPNKLRSRIVKISGPALIFVCSDGLPELVLTVPLFEQLILTAVCNSKSASQFEHLLRIQMQDRATDDCSISYAFVGFNDYEHIKSYFQERLAQLTSFDADGDIENLTRCYQSYTRHMSDGDGQAGFGL